MLTENQEAKLEIPKNVDQCMLEQLVCEQLKGFLLILTATGKIVFVSYTVENLLGHMQVSSLPGFGHERPPSHDLGIGLHIFHNVSNFDVAPSQNVHADATFVLNLHSTAVCWYLKTCKAFILLHPSAKVPLNVTVFCFILFGFLHVLKVFLL